MSLVSRPLSRFRSAVLRIRKVDALPVINCRGEPLTPSSDKLRNHRTFGARIQRFVKQGLNLLLPLGSIPVVFCSFFRFLLLFTIPSKPKTYALFFLLFLFFLLLFEFFPVVFIYTRRAELNDNKTLSRKGSTFVKNFYS